ncbi:MAG: cytochrome b/b6 domain-containing protein [Veillonellales bacterium]
MPEKAYILRHPLSSRLFHWGLVLGFLPTVITGLIIWWKPPMEDVLNLAMRIHIIGAGVFTTAALLFFLFAFDRVALFIRHISEWSRNDIRWMLVGGGYPHKIFLGEEIETPPMGKLNSGQKSMGAFMFHGGIFLLVSGWILYAFVPVVPREIAYLAGVGHEWVGLFMGASVFAHMGLGIYNQAEFKAMFGDGTIPLDVARKHNSLWVAHHVELVVHKKDTGTEAKAASQKS